MLKAAADPTEQQLLKVYAEYELACARAGAVDFAELLLRAYELWRDQADVLRHYRARFSHVLVDEFQDTNSIQYAWVRLLVGTEGYPFVVGDDDQSIYRWRGAKVENLHKFREDFPQAKMFRLEQNYRSTASILDAANALITHNSCGPAARAARRCSSTPPTMSAMKRSLSSTASASGWRRVVRARKWRSCIAPMPSRGSSRKVWYRGASPTESMAGCDSSSAPRSRTRWLTCA
jgi:ATP-dependent exoDNAse (exonuclease V) beta subunit